MQQAAQQSQNERTEAFANRLIGTFNEAALSLMISLGHRSGLFDTMAAAPPATSAEIAQRANLNERYVREWLGAMTTGRIVSYDPVTGRYALPPEHAASLTRGGENIAVFMQYISVLGSVEDDVLACFRDGGGVPYERYPRFHDVMAEDSGQTVLPALMDHILPLAPGLTSRLQEGIDVLDAGCGSGRALNLMAQQFPRSRFVGYDLSDEAVQRARGEAFSRGLGNVHFEARDLSRFAEEAPAQAFDLITTFDAVHDQAQPLELLRGIYRALRPGGVYLMQDIHGSSDLQNNMEHPIGPALYAISCMHCMSVSLAQGGEGLGTMWGREKATDYLRRAGFEDIQVHQLEHDFQNDYYVMRKPNGSYDPRLRAH
ncbi:methyltransferase domain-containing protein [Ectothiorhodospiraceae bacterium 2226]|nr:methyltransferase domain-containing protein [Ectothiorhodospiraceae bacterium 2226]